MRRNKNSYISFKLKMLSSTHQSALLNSDLPALILGGLP